MLPELRWHLQVAKWNCDYIKHIQMLMKRDSTTWTNDSHHGSEEQVESNTIPTDKSNVTGEQCQTQTPDASWWLLYKVRSSLYIWLLMGELGSLLFLGTKFLCKLWQNKFLFNQSAYCQQMDNMKFSSSNLHFTFIIWTSFYF
jgi:hypothetical protein